MKRQRIQAAAIQSVAAFAIMLWLFWIVIRASVMAPIPAATGAMLYAPTPVTVYCGPGTGTVVTMWSAARKTADAVSTPVVVRDKNCIDLQWIIDMATINTSTLKLQWSNDNSNWVDGPTIQSTVVADANTMQQYQTFGRYARVNLDVAGSQPVTLTIIGVAK